MQNPQLTRCSCEAARVRKKKKSLVAGHLRLAWQKGSPCSSKVKQDYKQWKKPPIKYVYVIPIKSMMETI